MKKFLASLFIFVFLSLLQANASDGTIALELDGYNNYKVPEYRKEVFQTINQDGEIASDDDYCPSYIDNDQTFESKTGQVFENFINQKVLEKKPSFFSQQIRQPQYNELK